jgi:trans-aconitate methyltransferase
MIADNPDKAWKCWGALDPYWAVCSESRFRSANISETSLRTFFDSGEEHVDWISRVVAEHLDAAFKPRIALDFGCGVGRVLIPLAKRCERVIGLDVSETMLSEARRNLGARGLDNVTLLRSDDRLSQMRSGYDFLHSYIVFQHIPMRRGLRITRRLVEGLEPGGIGALHYVFLNQAPLHVRMSKWVRKNVPLTHGVMNLLRGRPWRHPLMQMNAYSLNSLFRVLHETGCESVQNRFTNHEGYIGAVLFFRKGTQGAAGSIGADGSPLESVTAKDK